MSAIVIVVELAMSVITALAPDVVTLIVVTFAVTAVSATFCTLSFADHVPKDPLTVITVELTAVTIPLARLSCPLTRSDTEKVPAFGVVNDSSTELSSNTSSFSWKLCVATAFAIVSFR